jgi:TonB family protein
MNEIFPYLLKVSIAVALVSLPYFLFLRNDPTLFIKRIYLVAGVILSWVFPLLTVQKPLIATRMDPVFLIDPGLPATAPATIETAASQYPNISPDFVLGFIYLAGILVFLSINLISLSLLRKKREKPTGTKNIFLTNSEKVFTIYPNIFLPKKYTQPDEVNSILIHERAHIRQLHIADLLISEISLALTWFNPFSWLISRMIKENHEHLADRYVLKQGVNQAHYKALLLNHALGGEVFRLGHRLNHSLTKKRFNMMKKMKTPKSGITKYIFIVPAILACTLIATATTQLSKKISGTVYLENRATPAKGAAVIIAGTTMGTVTGPDGNFTLETEGNPDIAISFVGYKTVLKPASEIAEKSVILIPTTYTINYDDTEKTERKREVIFKKGESGDKNRKVIITDEDIERTEKDVEWFESAGSIENEIIRKIEVFKKDDGSPPMVFINGKRVDPADSSYIVEIDHLEKIKKAEGMHTGENAHLYKSSKHVSTIEQEDHNSSEKPGMREVIIETEIEIDDSGENRENGVVEKVFIKKKLREESPENSFISGGETFRAVERLPSFPGGKTALRDFIYNNLTYPKKAQKSQTAGEVMVGFTVDPEGKLTDIHVSQSTSDLFKDAALQVIKKMPAWEPALQQGEPVRAKVIVPVRFYPTQE